MKRSGLSSKTYSNRGSATWRTKWGELPRPFATLQRDMLKTMTTTPPLPFPLEAVALSIQNGSNRCPMEPLPCWGQTQDPT
jgi:hypothetical protein